MPATRTGDVIAEALHDWASPLPEGRFSHTDDGSPQITVTVTELLALARAAAAAELDRFAEEVERGADNYIANGASELIRAACREDKKIAAGLRARATALGQPARSNRA